MSNRARGRGGVGFVGGILDRFFVKFGKNYFGLKPIMEYELCKGNVPLKVVR